MLRLTARPGQLANVGFGAHYLLIDLVTC